MRSYATWNAIRGAILYIRKVTKRTETEAEYSLRLNSVATCCENVHSIYDKMPLYIDGLGKTIK